MKLPETLPALRRQNFATSYRQVAQQFKIKNVSRHKLFEDEKYVVLHVRGGDATAPHSHFNTFEILRQLPREMLIIVITDTDEYLPLIIPDHNISVLPSSISQLDSSPPASSNQSQSSPSRLRIFRLRRPTKRYEALMHDFNVLLGATGIIQHAKNSWSSYSSVAAMMNGIPLLNTWISQSPDPNYSKYVGMLEVFHNNAGLPDELRSSHRKSDVEHFLGVMRCEWDAVISRKKRHAVRGYTKNDLVTVGMQDVARQWSSGINVALWGFWWHRFTYMLAFIACCFS
jgi:hypothetical protein